MRDEAGILSEKVSNFIYTEFPDASADSEFEALAMEIFEFQFRSIEPYRRLCDRLGKTPARLKSWHEIPSVSCNSFKHFSMFSGRPEQIVRTFKSSGTSNASSCSKSHFSNISLELMNLAIEENAAKMLFPEGRQSRILALAPAPDSTPASIMTYGMSRIIDRFGLEGSGFLLGTGGMDVARIISAVEDCVAQGVPLSLIGSSFGFVNLFDALKERNREFVLAAGSRLMHAGGYKGRSREVDSDEFVEMACSLLGIANRSVINLLGMTELASQIYDLVLERDAEARRAKKPPHWMRTLLFDPTQATRYESPFITQADRMGLLRHFDLANIERPLAIQTEDLGRGVLTGKDVNIMNTGRGGFEIIGRAKGAQPKGCSISLEEFYRLRSAR